MVDLLRVNGLEVHYSIPNDTIHALNGVSFTLSEGETVGILGETGSGKSTLANALTNNLARSSGKVVSGKVYFRGQDLFALPKNDYQKICDTNIRLASLDFDGLFDSRQPLAKQIAEKMAPSLGIRKEDAFDQAVSLFQKVGIQDSSVIMDENLENLASGTRQLIMIALAFSSNPDVIILDNILSGLDVIHQSQVVELIRQMQAKTSLSVLNITHDPGLISMLADRVFVFSGGFIVEEGPVSTVFSNTQHPFTLALLGNVRRINSKVQSPLNKAEGFSPMRSKKPDHCPYEGNCQFAFDRCKRENPALINIGGNHKVACWMDIMNGKAR